MASVVELRKSDGHALLAFGSIYAVNLSINNRLGFVLPSTTPNFNQLPDSVKKFLSEIIQSGLANKLILFGSRARGDHRANSDFDIAVQWQNPSEPKIFELKIRLEESPISLYKIDLLDLNSAAKDYLDEIKKEGVLLWQEKA